MEKKYVKIKNTDGSENKVELVTYLFSKDEKTNYIVYSKGELNGAEEDEVIYVSRITNEGSNLIINEIVDDKEWSEVQLLLKKIANAQ